MEDQLILMVLPIKHHVVSASRDTQHSDTIATGESGFVFRQEQRLFSPPQSPD
jgi:hypothetical protein